MVFAPMPYASPVNKNTIIMGNTGLSMNGQMRLESNAGTNWPIAVRCYNLIIFSVGLLASLFENGFRLGPGEHAVLHGLVPVGF